MPEFSKVSSAVELQDNQYWPRYHFSDIHREEWKKFWESVDGDMEQCKKFAKSADIFDPTQWCASLYKFLFSVWPGDSSLLLKGSKSPTLQEYVVSIYQSHKNSPREKIFYTKLGTNYENFLEVLDAAKNIEYEYEIIQYINARIPAYGDRVFEEFVLQFSGFASDLTKKANRLHKIAQMVRDEAKKREIAVEISAKELVP